LPRSSNLQRSEQNGNALFWARGNAARLHTMQRVGKLTVGAYSRPLQCDHPNVH
jgi:hypothetical protein